MERIWTYVVIFFYINKRYLDGTKGAYTEWRKFLISDGYLKIQPEVFMRIEDTKKSWQKHKNRIKSHYKNIKLSKDLPKTEVDTAKQGNSGADIGAAAYKGSKLQKNIQNQTAGRKAAEEARRQSVEKKWMNMMMRTGSRQQQVMTGIIKWEYIKVNCEIVRVFSQLRFLPFLIDQD